MEDGTGAYMRCFCIGRLGRAVCDGGAGFGGSVFLGGALMFASHLVLIHFANWVMHFGIGRQRSFGTDDLATMLMAFPMLDWTTWSCDGNGSMATTCGNGTDIWSQVMYNNGLNTS
jgi:hypothetical protein